MLPSALGSKQLRVREYRLLVQILQGVLQTKDSCSNKIAKNALLNNSPKPKLQLYNMLGVSIATTYFQTNFPYEVLAQLDVKTTCTACHKLSRQACVSSSAKDPLHLLYSQIEKEVLRHRLHHDGSSANTSLPKLPFRYPQHGRWSFLCLCCHTIAESLFACLKQSVSLTSS